MRRIGKSVFWGCCVRALKCRKRTAWRVTLTTCSVRVANARAYDAFYQALIAEVRIYNVTALLSMEEIKSTPSLPIPGLIRSAQTDEAG